jgi:hypothetical protein
VVLLPELTPLPILLLPALPCRPGKGREGRPVGPASNSAVGRASASQTAPQRRAACCRPRHSHRGERLLLLLLLLLLLP